MSSSGIGVLRPGLHNVVWDKLSPWLLLDKKGESVRIGTIVTQYSSTVVKRCQVGLLILVTKGASTDETALQLSQRVPSQTIPGYEEDILKW